MRQSTDDHRQSAAAKSIAHLCLVAPDRAHQCKFRAADGHALQQYGSSAAASLYFGDHRHHYFLRGPRYNGHDGVPDPIVAIQFARHCLPIRGRRHTLFGCEWSQCDLRLDICRWESCQCERSRSASGNMDITGLARGHAYGHRKWLCLTHRTRHDFCAHQSDSIDWGRQ